MFIGELVFLLYSLNIFENGNVFLLHIACITLDYPNLFAIPIAENINQMFKSRKNIKPFELNYPFITYIKAFELYYKLYRYMSEFYVIWYKNENRNIIPTMYDKINEFTIAHALFFSGFSVSEATWPTESNPDTEKIGIINDIENK